MRKDWINVERISPVRHKRWQLALNPLDSLDQMGRSLRLL